MTYKEFDKKYNKRNYQRVIKRTSLINLDGDIIAQGTVEEMDNFCDIHCEFRWKNHTAMGYFYNGQEVVTTNVGNPAEFDDGYSKRFFAKLNFEVTF